MGSDNDALSSLRLGEVALRAVLEGLPDATVGATRDGTIVFVNALAESQFGYRREDLIGRPIELLWPQRVRDRYRRNMELYFTVEHPLSFTDRAYGLRRDGSEFVGEMSWGIVVAEGGRCCWRSAATSRSAWRLSSGSAGGQSSRPRSPLWASARSAASARSV